MKRFALALFLLLASLAAGAKSDIWEVRIQVNLQEDGSARITELWDVTVTNGTEWYLNRENLGDIEIRDLQVSEAGRLFNVEDEWDTDRGRLDKAGRCGLLHKRNGVEICWGIGDYGDHIWTVSYTMTNAVKSLRDADMLHLQLLSPGLSAEPQHVRADISGPFGKDQVRFWGFGLEGVSGINGHTVTFESKGEVKSMIVLLRFEKGIFSSPSVQDRGFEQVLAQALEGAHFEDEDSEEDSLFFKIIGILSTFLPMLLGVLVVWKAAGFRKRILGCKPKDVQWSREVPYDGNLEQSWYTASALGENKKGNTYASALILRMIYSGAIEVRKTGDNSVELAFCDAKAAGLDEFQRRLYEFMKEASGSDELLQDKEFSRWSRKHYKKVNTWIQESQEAGQKALKDSGQMKGSKYTPAGQAEARKLLGFKKFLSDFTLIGERGSREVGLWQEYLVFGALYGIADKVAKELHDIDPQFFEEVNAMDYNTANWILLHNNTMASAITNAQARAAEAMGRTSGSFGGFGGGTSFGGGGGFSGGGFGGGAR